MKTRDEFIKDVFEKSERARAAEAAARVRKKQRLRVVMGTVSAAACLTLVVGLSGMLDDAFWTRGNDAAAGERETISLLNQAESQDAGNAADDAAEDAGKTEDAQSGKTGLAGARDAEGSPSFDAGADKQAGERKQSGKDSSSSGKDYDAGNSGNAGNSGTADDSRKTASAGSDKAQSAENDANTEAYFCLPACMLEVLPDGSQTVIRGDRLRETYAEILNLSENEQAVCAKLGDPEPVSQYEKKIIYVFYGHESETGSDAGQIDFEYDNPQNTVWYIISGA